MSAVLVTGGTGLIGSAVCARLAQDGHTVRALVRIGSDASFLNELGAYVVRGDVSSATDVLRAAETCEYVIHAAALVTGGAARPDSLYELVNVSGTRNVLDAAQKAQIRRVVSFASAPDPRRIQIPEGAFAEDPYFRTKLTIAKEIIRRASEGDNIVEISPGATFGPAPAGRRAVEPPGFNSRIILALRRSLMTMPAFPSSFNLASDVARSAVAALDRGRSGERYDLGGLPNERIDTVSFLNIACERAGVSWRVEAMTVGALDDPATLERFGPSIVGLARSYLTQPEVPASTEPTTAMVVLGHNPMPVRPSVEATVDWMLAKRLVELPEERG